MSDSLPASGGAEPAEMDRSARIEQLLLSGLDQYFAGHYQQAINIWTRVVFLERGHSRARAYIERARSAMAERQREAEELVQNGIAAYNAGDTVAARDLLTRAVDQGGASDTAFIFLDRLNRISGEANAEAASAAPPIRTSLDPVIVSATVQTSRWLPTIIVSGVVAALVVMATLSVASWFTESTATPNAAPQAVVEEPLPIARPSDVVLERARALYEDGHLRDALRVLEKIDYADPIRPDADRLRGEVQLALLAAATGSPVPPPGRRP